MTRFQFLMPPRSQEAVQPGEIPAGLRVGGQLEGRYIVVRGQRHTVAPLLAFPNLDVPSQAVCGGFPAVGGQGADVEVLVQRDERVAEQVRTADGLVG